MSNKYSSIIRRLYSEANYSSAISPPTDYTIADAGFAYQRHLIFSQNDINPNSNIFVKSLGLWSNFADGLVLKTQGAFLNVRLAVNSYIIGSTLSGIFTTSRGSTTLTTSVSQSFSPGDKLLLTDRIYNILSGSGTSWVLREYAVEDYVEGGTVNKLLTSVGGDSSVDIPITLLNTMYPVDILLLPSQYSTTSALYISLQGAIFPKNTVFLTKSINTSFATDQCYFNTIFDLEFTKGS